MSTVVNRGGIWQARYTDAQGKQHRTSTYIPGKGGNGLTAREAKKAAESIAAGLEASVKGAASERIIRTVQMQLETVAIAGDPGTGKPHVLLDIIITGLLGAYTNMPTAWLSGESRFNDWALSSNIWVADDGVSLQSIQFCIAPY